MTIRTVVGFIIVAFSFVLLSGCDLGKNHLQGVESDIISKSMQQDFPDENTDFVCISKQCFFVEIADDQRERMNGLMGRSSLEKNAGMLFIFDEGGAGRFWMKNTLIPLDMLWIDSGGTIVHIHENAVPCPPENGNNCPSYGPTGPSGSTYVLELGGGLVTRYDFSVGDTVRFLGQDTI